MGNPAGAGLGLAAAVTLSRLRERVGCRLPGGDDRDRHRGGQGDGGEQGEGQDTAHGEPPELECDAVGRGLWQTQPRLPLPISLTGRGTGIYREQVWKKIGSW